VVTTRDTCKGSGEDFYCQGDAGTAEQCTRPSLVILFGRECFFYKSFCGAGCHILRAKAGYCLCWRRVIVCAAGEVQFPISIRFLLAHVVNRRAVCRTAGPILSVSCCTCHCHDCGAMGCHSRNHTYTHLRQLFSVLLAGRIHWVGSVPPSPRGPLHGCLAKLIMAVTAVVIHYHMFHPSTLVHVIFQLGCQTCMQNPTNRPPDAVCMCFLTAVMSMMVFIAAASGQP
jgi:hypothetical protein